VYFLVVPVEVVRENNWQKGDRFLPVAIAGGITYLKSKRET
jgi:hypothetical protein